MFKLSDLVSIQTGLVLSRKQARYHYDVIKKYRQLNLKAIHNNGYIEACFLEEFWANEILSPDYITQSGDIIVRLTTPYTAVLIDEEFSGIVVPSHFIILRTNGQKLLPDYLYWLLNTEQVKRSVARDVSSTMIGAVKPTVYAELDIDLLPMEEQYKIAHLYHLVKKELYLLERLKEEKKLFYNQTLLKIQENVRSKRNEDYKK